MLVKRKNAWDGNLYLSKWIKKIRLMERWKIGNKENLMIYLYFDI
jgi:hypothetical protein